jgi:branched-subunit amino acid transport protein
METHEIGLTILFTSLATALCRLVPAIVLADRKFSPVMKSFLHFCPVAILCGMIAPDVLLQQGSLDFSFSNKFFWVFIPCVLMAVKTRNIPITVVASVSLLALWRAFEF